MSKKKFLFISIIVMLIGTTFLFFLIKKIKKINPDKIIKAVTNLADLKINKFKLQQIFENNGDKWILKAQNGQIFRDKHIATCKQSKAIFINKNKKLAILRAPEMNFYLKENRIEMHGGIKSIIINPRSK